MVAGFLPNYSSHLSTTDGPRVGVGRHMDDDTGFQGDGEFRDTARRGFSPTQTDSLQYLDGQASAPPAEELGCCLPSDLPRIFP